MNRKIIFSIIIVFLSGLFIHNNVIAQINRPFGACYQAAFSGCSNCSDSTIESKIINYFGCEIKTTYKIIHCNCPTPTTFVDIEYFRVDPSSSACQNLMCLLYPPINPPCIYDPSRINVDEYKAMARYAYDHLIQDLFQEVKDEYHDPNTLTFKVFWPASCNAVCQLRLMENDSLILQTKPCNLDLCCGIQYECTLLSNGSIQTTTTQITGPITCYMPWGTSCDYSPGDEIILSDGIYHVLSASISECSTFCDNPK